MSKIVCLFMSKKIQGWAYKTMVTEGEQLFSKWNRFRTFISSGAWLCIAASAPRASSGLEIG